MNRLWNIDPVCRQVFLQAYIEAALWSTPDDAEVRGEHLDATFNAGDLAAEALTEMREDCNVFIRNNRFNLMTIEPRQAGHDFWLTRNGHGVGFWDRGLGELGDRLTKAAYAFGNVDLYAGDDGKLYLM
jgi:hypothetical protein